MATVRNAARPFGVLVCAALGAWTGLAQLHQPTLSIDGSPIVTSRPAQRIGSEWFLPLLPIARALGAEVGMLPDFQGLRVRRQEGTEVVYDSRTGEIRSRFLLVGRVKNPHLLQIVAVDEELLFPLEGVVALLGVNIREDSQRNVLRIHSERASNGQEPLRGPLFNLARFHYRYGLVTNGRMTGHFTDLQGEGLLGGTRITTKALLSRYPDRAGLAFSQGLLRVDLSSRRALIFGDQSTFYGIDALGSPLRGGSYQTIWNGFSTYLYGGRAVSSTSATIGPLAFAKYDTTLAGLGLRRKWNEGDIQVGINSFAGRTRKGATIGAGYGRSFARNQFKLQALFGQFAGLSSRSRLVKTTEWQPLEPATDGDPLLRDAGGIVVDENGQEFILREIFKRTPARGSAVGFQFANTFTPFRQLTVSTQVEHYGKHFLAAAEDPRFNARSSKAASVMLRPNSWISFNGGINQGRFLLGDPTPFRHYHYGANIALPGRYGMQFAFFKSIQFDSAMPDGRFDLAQYSVTVPNLRSHTIYAQYSEIKLGRELIRTVSTTFSMGRTKYGRFGLHDQVQFGAANHANHANHANTRLRYGADWYLDLRESTGFLRVGIDRVAHFNGSAGYFPVLGCRIGLPGGQSLEMTYWGAKESHTLQLQLGGILFRQRELTRENRGVQSVIVPSQLRGRIYSDVDFNESFTEGVDRPISDIQVWLDDSQSVVTDAQGLFRFDLVQPGAHRVRADLSGIPADMVFADPAERTIAVMPYRDSLEDFRVVRTGQIAGKVTYLQYLGDGGTSIERPLPDARIIASPDLETFSELNGVFLLGDLVPGIYQLRLDPATVPSGYAARPASITVEVKPGQVLRDASFQLVIPPRPVIERELPAQISSLADHR